DLLRLPFWRHDCNSLLQQVGRRIATLIINRAYFNGFDALVSPERTSLLLKRLRIARPKFIWTKHGAGDRGSGFDPDVASCDFVLLPGAKTERRMLDLGLIQRGRYVSGVYAKFDYVLQTLPRRSRF